jgi:hypothetical protein
MNQRTFTGVARGLTLLIVVVCFGLIVLDRAQIFGDNLRTTTNLLYAWAIILGAFALLLGAFNVMAVHIGQIQRGAGGWSNSLALLAAFFVVVVAGLLHPAGAASPMVEWLFTNLIAPGQAALFAVLAFFMAAAAYRYLRVSAPGGAWLLTGALLMLIAQLPAGTGFVPDALVSATAWLLQVPAMAALRGALLGMSLAMVVVGLRTIVGRS